MEEQRAICYNDISIYRCTNNQSGFLNVEFELVSGHREPFTFSKLLTSEGTIRNVAVGSSPVIINVTSSMESFISVIFIILNPVSLIGTTMICNEDTIHVNVSPRNSSKSSLANKWYGHTTLKHTPHTCTQAQRHTSIVSNHKI